MDRWSFFERRQAFTTAAQMVRLVRQGHTWQDVVAKLKLEGRTDHDMQQALSVLRETLIRKEA